MKFYQNLTLIIKKINGLIIQNLLHSSLPQALLIHKLLLPSYFYSLYLTYHSY